MTNQQYVCRFELSNFRMSRQHLWLGQPAMCMSSADLWLGWVDQPAICISSADLWLGWVAQPGIYMSSTH